MKTEDFTLMIVDDDGDLRKVVQRGLSSAGYRVMEAADAESALNILHTEVIHLLLLDIGLPGMSGVDLLREINENLHIEVPLVLMLTGVSDRDEVLSCIELGAQGYVLKPAKLPELRARIWKLLYEFERHGGDCGKSTTSPG